MIQSKSELSTELAASWTVHVGDMDQVVNIWRYTGGFAAIDKAQAVLEKDAVSSIEINFQNFETQFFFLLFTFFAGLSITAK